MERLPEIETNRLVLGTLETTDIPLIVKYASNKNVSDNTQNIPFPYSEKDAAKWINLAREGLKNKTNYIFAIRLKSHATFIGGIGLTIDQKSLRAEMGYWIAEPFWNTGYTTEAAEAIIKFAFEELGLNKITSSHFEKNPASGKVVIKCGMTQEGILKEHIYKSPAFHTLVLYGLTRADYTKNNSL